MQGEPKGTWKEGEHNGHLFVLSEGRMTCSRCQRQARNYKYWAEIRKEPCRSTRTWREGEKGEHFFELRQDCMVCTRCGRKASNAKYWKEIGSEPCKGAEARRAPWREGEFNGHSFKLIEGAMQCQWCYRQAETKKYWQELKREKCKFTPAQEGSTPAGTGEPPHYRIKGKRPAHELWEGQLAKRHRERREGNGAQEGARGQEEGLLPLPAVLRGAGAPAPALTRAP